MGAMQGFFFPTCCLWGEDPEESLKVISILEQQEMQSELLCLAASSTSLQESVLCCFPHPAGLEWARIEAQAGKEIAPRASSLKMHSGSHGCEDK